MRITILGLIAMAALACRGEPSGLSARSGVTLDLTVSATSLTRGEPDTITMILTNRSPRVVTLSSGACEPRAAVTSGSGELVAPGPTPCILVLLVRQLRPGERIVRVFVWNTDSMDPGVYNVGAAFSAQEMQLAARQQPVRLN